MVQWNKLLSPPSKSLCVRYSWQICHNIRCHISHAVGLCFLSSRRTLSSTWQAASGLNICFVCAPVNIWSAMQLISVTLDVEWRHKRSLAATWDLLRDIWIKMAKCLPVPRGQRYRQEGFMSTSEYRHVTVNSENVLTMVYDTENYWVSGLCPSSGIVETRKHNVSETGSVSVLRWGEAPSLLGPLERANHSQWTTHVSINTAI
jgi:hypothetical protein